MTGSKKDLYEVLGVTREASPRQLREAFQELALRHHPDRAGAEQTGAFQEIAEAYQVLSDPGQRSRYDSCRCAAQPGSPPRAAQPVEPLLRPEPLVRGEPWRPHRRAAHRHLPTLTIDPATALFGGSVSVRLPLTVRCPACNGWLGCPRCGGSGRIQLELPLRLRLPPATRDGTVVLLEIPRVGELELRIRVY